MKSLVALLSAAAVLFGTAAPAAAETCGATIVDASGTLYVVVDDALLPDTVSLWIYQESNGEPGLQRADDVCPGDGHPADTIIY